jgi:hypothetical protein
LEIRNVNMKYIKLEDAGKDYVALELEINE